MTTEGQEAEIAVGEQYGDALWRIKEVETGNVLRDAIDSEREYLWLLAVFNRGEGVRRRAAGAARRCRPRRSVKGMPTAATDRRVEELIDRLACEDARFDRAIGNPLQEAINAIESVEAAREYIRRAAAVAHAAFPHYEGHWSGEEWQIGVIGSRVRTKIGVVFEAGDVVLFKREGYGNTETTAYSIRNGVDAAVDVYARPRTSGQ